MSNQGRHRPVCERPSDLVEPVRCDPAGERGPTRSQARGRAWEQVARGWHAPSSRRASVEQRILDAGIRLPGDASRGAVTGWAALRWRGAAFFDGLGPGGEGLLPVELAVRTVHDNLRPSRGVVLNRRRIRPEDRSSVAGLAVAGVHRALFDEIARRGELWEAVAAIDMVAAAGLTSVWRFAAYAGDHHSHTGVPLVREAVALAVDESRSPRETWLRMVWTHLAGLPEPHVNPSVYDVRGRFLGAPDLLEPVAGLVVEYDGEVHLTHSARCRDVERENALREAGLEYVTVVRGQSRERVADTLQAAYARALARAGSDRRWTLERPAGVPRPETLDERLDRRDRATRAAS